MFTFVLDLKAAIISAADDIYCFNYIFRENKYAKQTIHMIRQDLFSQAKKKTD